MAKVGIIGFAHGHVFAFGGEWVKKPELGVTIACGWDHDEQRGRDGCGKLGIKYAAELGDILGDDEIDSVVVTAETSFHAEYIEAAAAAGKKIICYKPLALNMEQADRIVGAVEKHGAEFSMGWQMRADQQNIKIKEMLDSGDFGKVYMIRRRHGLATHKMKDFGDSWHASPIYNRDIFADDSAHPIDFIYWLMGMPETASAEFTSLVDPKVPNDNGIAVFKYHNGALAEVMCSFTCIAADNTVEIYCEKGTILLNYGDVPSTVVPHPQYGLKWFLDGDADWTHSDIPSPVSHGERISGQSAALADFLCTRRGPIATASEGRDALRMVLACYVSNGHGQRVSMDDKRICEIV
jgi:predicted dehydrogenase